jgi:cytochrome c biogenesis protein CcmG, thiol:disulfide interchange protein DsbE
VAFPRPLKLMAQTLAVALVAGLLALLVWKVVHQNSTHLGAELAAGQTPVAPVFTLPRLDAPGRVTLASLRGKAVVINFWASWCRPCKQEAPRLEAAYRRWSKRGVVVLGIDGQDFSGDAKRFARNAGISYPIVHDGPGNTIDRYGVTGFPETFFVGRNGKLVGNHVEGAISDAQLEQNITLALRTTT